MIKNMAPRVGHPRMAEILHSQVFRMSNLYLERELALDAYGGADRLHGIEHRHPAVAHIASDRTMQTSVGVVEGFRMARGDRWLGHEIG